jgi:FOG: WD40-like repeat
MEYTFIKNRKTFYSVLSLLLLTFALLASFPTLMADDAYHHTTYIHAIAAPNPQLVGASVYITFIIDNVPPSVYPSSAPRYFWWSGVSLAITYPDGSVKNVTDLQTSYAGAGTYTFTPTQAGNYSVIASFAGETIPSGPSAGIIYSPSISTAATFTVTSDASQITPLISYPLPTEYWTFPIESENQHWYSFAGGWLAGKYVDASVQSVWNPYTDGPYSAHVLWSREWTIGGLVGGKNLDQQYQFGRWPGGSDQYFSPYISNGIMYVNLPQYFVNSNGAAQPAGFEAIDLKTNQVLWKQTAYNNSLSYLQLLYYGHSTTATGTTELLWDTASTTWRTFDPLTGNLLQTITGAASGGKVTFGPNGELMIYYINPNGWLACWNSTYFEESVEQIAGVTFNQIYDPNVIYVIPQGAWNFSLGYMWNITVPKIPGLGFTAGTLPNDMLICSASVAATNTSAPMNTLITFSIKPTDYTPAPYNIQGLGALQSTTGSQSAKVLWGPQNMTIFPDSGMGFSDRVEAAGYTDDGTPVFVIYPHQTLSMDVYNALTGQKICSTEPFSNAFAVFTGASNNIQIADNRIFAGGYDGTMSCFNITTGKLIWSYYVGNAGENTAYGSWPIEGSYSNYAIGGHVVYMGANEHSPNDPTWLGGQIWAVNDTDGTLLWKIDSVQDETQPLAVYANQAIYLNFYDGKIYDIGKGPSATTVAAPQASIIKGQSLTITGTVMDKSVGTTQAEQAGRFPNGLPAISDASMNDWMNYVYMQKPKPTNATGVPVTLSVIDSNGNYRTIGDVTTDINGFFSYQYTPD